MEQTIEEGSIANIRCLKCDCKEAGLNKFKNYSELKDTSFTPAIPFGFFRGILLDRLCVKCANLFYSQIATRLGNIHQMPV